ncbi:MAG: hypothetical protein K5745_01185 [Saccharofermentans sp.]|nr:hypothetical protein [Saccharofermentans sp.]
MDDLKKNLNDIKEEIEDAEISLDDLEGITAGLSDAKPMFPDTINLINRKDR